ncbi:MAG: diguanylate cyclase [Desulfobulbaceae bacterium]|nr:diguanylate cyclase [Desulfobulbaceae bacterium]HIJ89356.1 diguanylate cyclase [Deltaproteobacteria bacterium]
MQTEKDQATGNITVRNDRKKSWNGREVVRLRLLFLAPLTIAILAIVTALMLALYWHEHQSVQKGVMRIRASAQDFYEDSIRYDARALKAVMDTLQRDPLLRAALAGRDRQRLLRQAAPLFQELKQDYAITHFYFTGTDRVNLLRVHTPTRFGDRIDRITTLSAEENRTTSFGVELGPLGTFTLRLVTPWYDTETHELIGYVELGMEIDRVLQKLRDFFGVEVFVLVHKDRLDRNKWEDGMRTLGHPCDWERFPTVVLSSQTPQSVPTLLAERLARGELGDPNTIVEAAHGGASYRIAFLPLQDAGGNSVAHMALIADVSQQTDAALKTVYAGSLTALAAGILLLGFFNWHVGRIGRRIESDAQTLEELATHDGLTGLYNHRAFYTHLEAEIARTQRYKHPLSLLMIDIDHFKQVNDIHGHQAGDAILQSLSKCLADQVRVVDQVYRYGGEEIAVILPDTDTPFILAERIRAAVAATRFELDTGKAVGITVSIGIACFPRNAETGQQLVSAADTALYTAKKEGRNRVCEYQNPMQAENYP